MKPHAGKARGSLLDSEIPGSGDVTPLFHMTGLSHPGAGSPVRAASSQWARPRCDTRISASSGQRSGKKAQSQFGSRVSGDHGFVTSACVRRPARPVRPLDPPVWVVRDSFFFVCAVIRPGKLRRELHLGRLEPEMKRPGAFSVKERDCSRKLPNVFVLCLIFLCGVSFCKAFIRAQKKSNAMICAMFQDEF